jgi:plastocyanin
MLQGRVRHVAVLFALAACGSDGGSQVDAAISDGARDAPIDAPALVNGCTFAASVDLTAAAASRNIQVQDDFYTPKCPRITVGQAVTWLGDFQDHPLSPGILRGNTVEDQPGTPITLVTTGTSHSVTFAQEGAWAFYCPNHPPGMAGVVYVVP